MPGSWSAPISAPFPVGPMLLLTDGSVLAGFGAEAFLGFLNGLLTRIFAVQVGPSRNVRAGAPRQAGGT